MFSLEMQPRHPLFAFLPLSLSPPLFMWFTPTQHANDFPLSWGTFG